MRTVKKRERKSSVNWLQWNYLLIEKTKNWMYNFSALIIARSFLMVVGEVSLIFPLARAWQIIFSLFAAALPLRVRRVQRGSSTVWTQKSARRVNVRWIQFRNSDNIFSLLLLALEYFPNPQKLTSSCSCSRISLCIYADGQQTKKREK